VNKYQLWSRVRNAKTFDEIYLILDQWIDGEVGVEDKRLKKLRGEIKRSAKRDRET